MQRSARAKPAKAYSRMARVNALLREVLGDAVERIGDHEEGLGLLTVTEVACEPDLRRAVVYLSSLTDAEAAILEEHRIRIQRRVATEVRMKRTPMLVFRADPAVAAGARVEEALRRALPPRSDDE
jgi:ribosome-binding factor A